MNNFLDQKISFSFGIFSRLLLFLQVLVSTLYCLGFSLFSSVSMAFLLFLNVLFGSYAYILISKKQNFNVIELFAFGVGLGTSVPALINFGCRTLGYTGWSTAWMFPIGMLVIGLVSRNRPRLQTCEISTVSYFDLVLVLFMPIIGLGAWAQDLLGFLILFVISLPALWFFESRSTGIGWLQPARLIAFTVFPMGMIVSRILIRVLDRDPIWRSLVGVDIAFDEAVAFGVSRFGIFDNSFLAGQRTYGHVLTHAWAGDLAMAANAPRFMVTASFGFFIALIGISALTYSISIRLFNSTRAARLSLILLFVQGSMPEEYVLLNTLRMAHAISIMWLLAFCYLLVQALEDEVRFPYLIIGMGVFTVTMSKVHWGLIAVVILASMALEQLLYKRSFKFLPYLILTSIIFYCTYKFAYPSGNGFPSNFGISRNFVYEIVGLLVLRFFIGIGIFDAKCNSPARIIALVSTVFALIVHFALAGEYSSDYWVSFAFIWLSIFTGKFAAKAMNSFESYGIARLLVYAGSFLTGAWFTYYFFKENYYLILINARSWRSWFVVSNPELIPLTLVFLITTLSYFAFRQFRSDSRSIGLGAVFVLVAIFFNAGVWLAQSQRVNILEHYYDIDLTSDFVLSDTQIEMGEWITQNTDSQAVLATNFLCDIQIENGDPFPLTRENDCLNRNTLSWLASIAHRRVLIESPVYSGSYIGSAQQISDYNTSLGYGRDRNDQSLKYLMNRDVDYFVFDKANSRVHKLLVFRDALFENIDYAIVPISSIKVL